MNLTNLIYDYTQLFCLVLIVSNDSNKKITFGKVNHVHGCLMNFIILIYVGFCHYEIPSVVQHCLLFYINRLSADNEYHIIKETFLMSRLDGKVALVTGGGSGLGEAMVRLFADEGAKVVLSDIDEDRGNEIVDDLNSNGHDALFIKQDVTKEADWEATIKQILDVYDALNVVVNNAGIGMLRDIERTTLDEWNRVISINLDSVFLGTKHAIDGMKAKGSTG